MMDSLIQKFPAQLKEAMAIGQASVIGSHDHTLNKIYVAGMGGSGIGADFVASFIKDECTLPFLIGKSYDVPQYIDAHTLVIVSSYSGNTEETLMAFEKIQNRGCKFVIVSSGGKLIELAKRKGYDYIQLPGDWPSPRACVGFSMVQQLYILYKLDLISDTKIKAIRAASDLLNYDQDDIKIRAKKLAEDLKNKIPVLYIMDRMEPVALRARQQINENAKMLCWHNIIPEMNHNELVGWTSKNDDLAVVFLRNVDDYDRNKARLEINKEIISKYCSTVIEIQSKGQSFIEQSLYFVHLVDWLSWYLSVSNGSDAIEIDVIDYLKAQLAKF